MKYRTLFVLACCIAAALSDYALAGEEISVPPGLSLIAGYVGAPYITLVCQQGGKLTLDRERLDFVEFYADSTGHVRFIKYTPVHGNMLTMLVSPDTTCRILRPDTTK